MTRKCFNRLAMFLTVVVLVGAPSRPAAAQAAAAQGAAAQDQSKTTYTLVEYNQFQAANSEKDPQTRLKLLDDFVAKFPTSTLMPYVDTLYYQTYSQLKNYPKTIEWADKLVALGDKVDAQTRLQAIQARVAVFTATYSTMPKTDLPAQLPKERDAALEGASLLDQLPKPASVTGTDDDWKKQKMPGLAFFYAAAGFADLQLKDYPAAVTAFKNALANKPDDAVSAYRLGLAYLNLSPPQSLDGFWALARAIDLKVPDADKIKDYLQKQILAYEQPGCDSQATDQVNELLQLAQNSPERPATWTLPSQADLKTIQQASNILSLIADLGAGGDKAKMTWLAICGAEFPEVVGKIIDVKPGDAFIDFMVYTGASADEMQNATTANMDVKVWTAAPPAGSTPTGAAAAGTTPVPPQPDVARLQKDDPIRFSGTLVSYDPSPLMLHWDQVKVDPTIIPEKGNAGKHKPVPKKNQ
jgi:tetratricopeptide (TPR) repeat protein